MSQRYQKIIDPEMSDATYFAMFEEFTGRPLGDCLDELEEAGLIKEAPLVCNVNPIADMMRRCDICGKTFKTPEARAQHWRDKCGKVTT